MAWFGLEVMIESVCPLVVPERSFFRSEFKILFQTGLPSVTRTSSVDADMAGTSLFLLLSHLNPSIATPAPMIAGRFQEPLKTTVAAAAGCGRRSEARGQDLFTFTSREDTPHRKRPGGRVVATAVTEVVAGERDVNKMAWS